MSRFRARHSAWSHLHTLWWSEWTLTMTQNAFFVQFWRWAHRINICCRFSINLSLSVYFTHWNVLLRWPGYEFTFSLYMRAFWAVARVCVSVLRFVLSFFELSQYLWYSLYLYSGNIFCSKIVDKLTIVRQTLSCIERTLSARPCTTVSYIAIISVCPAVVFLRMIIQLSVTTELSCVNGRTVSFNSYTVKCGT